jgi:DUF4097 and DUF4098 domain-containing protein YvlB
MKKNVGAVAASPKEKANVKGKAKAAQSNGDVNVTGKRNLSSSLHAAD